MDDLTDYREALARAEAAATATDEKGEVVDRETPVVVEELAGAVPVQASDQPPTEEPVVETDTSEEQQQVAPAVEEPLTVEQLQERLAQAESRLAEKDSFIGRQSGEVGELRSTVDAYAQRLADLEAKLAQPVVTQPQVAPVPVTQADIDTDPATATIRAYENGKALGVTDPMLERAFSDWKELDPFAAGQWLTDRRLEQQQAAFDARFAEQSEKIETVNARETEAEAAAAERAAWNEAFIEVQKEHPDFLAKDEDGVTNAERLLTEVAPQFPAIAEVIKSGDAEAKAQGMKLLLGQSKLANPEQFGKELQDAAQVAAEEAAAVRAAAGVVSGQATVGQHTETKTEEQVEVERQMARIGSGPSLRKGWSRMNGSTQS